MNEHEWIFESTDETATRRLGLALAAAVEPGTVVALVGNLGAGKTRFVQAVAEGLGVPEGTAASPTFVLIHEYDGRLPIFHLDTYRLRDLDEFRELGVDELCESNGVVLVEWADRFEQALPADRLRIEIEITGESTRRFVLSATGPLSTRVLARMRPAESHDPHP